MCPSETIIVKRLRKTRVTTYASYCEELFFQRGHGFHLLLGQIYREKHHILKNTFPELNSTKKKSRLSMFPQQIKTFAQEKKTPTKLERYK